MARDLRQRCGIAGGEHLLVAVSGGADSVALLRALAVLAPRRRWGLTLTVGHVQHHLRGDAAEADATFVARLAEQLQLPYHRADLTPPPSGANVEAWARRQRYAALKEMAPACGATHVVTAHQADDQLETLLMRLLRGTAVTGLRGIAWRRSFMFQVSSSRFVDIGTASDELEQGTSNLKLIRPMLGVTRAEVLDFLHALGQSWREDHTNADLTRDRARLRHEVTPVLRAMRADAPRKATRLADHAREVHGLVRREIERQYEQLVRMEGGALAMDRAAVRRLPRVVVDGLLRRVLGEVGVPRDRLTRRGVTPIVRAVRDAAGGERRFALARGARVVVTAAVVRVEVTPTEGAEQVR